MKQVKWYHEAEERTLLGFKFARDTEELGAVLLSVLTV